MEKNTISVVTDKSEEIKLTGYTFLDNKVTIMLPQTMKLLSSRGKKKHITKAQKPEVVVADEGEEVFLSLSSCVSDKNNEQNNDKYITERGILERMVPGYVEYDCETKAINGYTVVCMQYKSDAIDKELYNIFFTFSMGDEVVYGVFCCPFQAHEKWTKTVLTCLETMKVNA